MSDEKGDAATAPAVVAERDGEPQQPQPQQEQEHGGETRESTATDAKDEGEKPENGGGGKEEKEEEPKKNGEEEIPEGVIPDLEVSGRANVHQSRMLVLCCNLTTWLRALRLYCLRCA